MDFRHPATRIIRDSTGKMGVRTALGNSRADFSSPLSNLSRGESSLGCGMLCKQALEERIAVDCIALKMIPEAGTTKLTPITAIKY